MANTIYDRNSRNIGKIIESGGATCYYDENSRLIGKAIKSGSWLCLYNASSRLIAKTDGNNTYDSNSHNIGRGNLFLKILYPDMAKII